MVKFPLKTEALYIAFRHLVNEMKYLPRDLMIKTVIYKNGFSLFQAICSKTNIYAQIKKYTEIKNNIQQNTNFQIENL